MYNHLRPSLRPVSAVTSDPIGNPMANDPDDALSVADQGDAGATILRDVPAPEEIGQRHALSTHPEWLEPIARRGGADRQREDHPVEVDGLVARHIIADRCLDDPAAAQGTTTDPGTSSAIGAMAPEPAEASETGRARWRIRKNFSVSMDTPPPTWTRGISRSSTRAAIRRHRRADMPPSGHPMRRQIRRRTSDRTKAGTDCRYPCFNTTVCSDMVMIAFCATSRASASIARWDAAVTPRAGPGHPRAWGCIRPPAWAGGRVESEPASA